MDCVNHNGVQATAFCQNCGKALCTACTRILPGGQVLCEPCAVAWQNLQQPFVVPPSAGAPNPAAAAILGLIPGVGAMYNGQFFKALVHVVIFAVLISITTHYGLFGIFIGAWVLYQSFEAYHTAAARRDGLPLPDPLGLNELGNWLNLGSQPHVPPHQPPAGPGTTSGPSQPAAAYHAQYQAPPTGTDPYRTPGYTPVAGFTDPAAPPVPPVPPVPPLPPLHWRRREPIGAVILIGLGLILLLNQLGFAERVVHFLWPLLFIAIGGWLIFRRVGDVPPSGP